MATGITENGFERKRLDEILSDKDDEVRGVFGDDINLDPQSPDGQINAASAESDANLWELAEESYNAFNPSAALASALDNLAELTGITRLEATKTTVTLTMSGTNGTVIPSGAIVESTALDQFQTIQSGTISGGTVDILAEAIEDGQIVAASGSITTIITPEVGWDTVTNSADAVIGRLRETDEELRIRRNNSVAFPSQSMIDSQFAAIANIEDVRAVVVLENDTDSVDGNGQPAHSTQAIVQGGLDADIAQIIFNEKAPGPQAFGTTIEVVNDDQGLPHNIGLTRPTPISIHVEINLTTNSEYPSDGDDQIKQAIADYTADEFGLGEDVIYSRLFTPINSIPGHSVNTLEIDIVDPPTGTSNISIDFDEISDFEIANIDIT